MASLIQAKLLLGRVKIGPALCAAILMLLILLTASHPMRAQAVNATVLGTVTDSSGAPAGNAKVTITETNTGISHSSQTNDSGNYIFPD